MTFSNLILNSFNADERKDTRCKSYDTFQSSITEAFGHFQDIADGILKNVDELVSNIIIVIEIM